ncbi:phosphoadenosine phosphosulfate reductase family protein [Mesorhizobium sp.]|uniref:phosphoadenosine phosphosulfate reductase family protein n=1 Tax=Mesorhizobium sp. TaxID=1871066 RepID=UPI0025E78957|nr:phosphoadenosine phosphosulfate reductase family protein [Mesorhizobium sp.]
MTTIVVSVDDAVRDQEARHIVPVSGGKDSSALAVYLRQRNPEVRFEYVFSDTGVELPETYDYLDRLENVLGIDIARISAMEQFDVKEKPGRTAFDVALYEHFAGFLPSPRARWCTRVMKIAPFERFVGSDRAYSYIGIRADENRAGYLGTGGAATKPVVISERPNITPVYPYKDDAIGLEDVSRILESAGLGLPDYYQWRSRSGCYFCFYQQIGEWQGLKERHPELYERAKMYEVMKRGRKYTWVDGRSLEDVERMPRREVQAKEEDGCAVCHL